MQSEPLQNKGEIDTSELGDPFETARLGGVAQDPAEGNPGTGKRTFKDVLRFLDEPGESSTHNVLVSYENLRPPIHCYAALGCALTFSESIHREQKRDNGGSYFAFHVAPIVQALCFVYGPTVITAPSEEQTQQKCLTSGSVNIQNHERLALLLIAGALHDVYEDGCGPGKGAPNIQTLQGELLVYSETHLKDHPLTTEEWKKAVVLISKASSVVSRYLTKGVKGDYPTCGLAQEEIEYFQGTRRDRHYAAALLEVVQDEAHRTTAVDGWLAIRVKMVDIGNNLRSDLEKLLYIRNLLRQPPKGTGATPAVTGEFEEYTEKLVRHLEKKLIGGGYSLIIKTFGDEYGRQDPLYRTLTSLVARMLCLAEATVQRAARAADLETANAHSSPSVPVPPLIGKLLNSSNTYVARMNDIIRGFPDPIRDLVIRSIESAQHRVLNKASVDGSPAHDEPLSPLMPSFEVRDLVRDTPTAEALLSAFALSSVLQWASTRLGEFSSALKDLDALGEEGQRACLERLQETLRGIQQDYFPGLGESQGLFTFPPQGAPVVSSHVVFRWIGPLLEYSSSEDSLGTEVPYFRDLSPDLALVLRGLNARPGESLIPRMLVLDEFGRSVEYEAASMRYGTELQASGDCFRAGYVARSLANSSWGDGAWGEAKIMISNQEYHVLVPVEKLPMLQSLARSEVLESAPGVRKLLDTSLADCGTAGPLGRLQYVMFENGRKGGGSGVTGLWVGLGNAISQLPAIRDALREPSGRIRFYPSYNHSYAAQGELSGLLEFRPTSEGVTATTSFIIPLGISCRGST